MQYALNDDKVSYSVIGIGTATDTDIIIANIYNGYPVTSIGSAAFSGCSNLTSIEIPNSVTNIGRQAFAYCTRLNSILIPGSVTNMGRIVFQECPNITIYAEAEIQQSGWNSDWNPSNSPVVWGYTGE